MIPNNKQDYELADAMLKGLVALDSVKSAEKLLSGDSSLLTVLLDPTVKEEEKDSTIDKLFEEDIRDYIKAFCKSSALSSYKNIFSAFEELVLARSKTVKVKLSCVAKPSEEELKGYTKLIKRDFDVENVVFDTIIDPNLLGGAKLEAQGRIYDFSLRSGYEQLKRELSLKNKKTEIGSSDVISVLKNQISDFEMHIKMGESGTVLKLGDGIATVYGLDSVMYGELVQFDTGTIGIVQNIEEKSVGVILLGSDHGITEGSRVARTNKRAGVPVSNAIIGRVVNSLGAPVDGGAEIEAEDYYPIEQKAPGIMERQSVNAPLQTGILAIDSMFPIGRGQRELIIGDRQTGKTSIALDTILNQKGQNVVCIYVAIGQKASTVASLADTLRKNGAMDYSVIVSSTAGDPAPLQYISPYTGTAIGEYFMHQGRDVLIIYDDLSKHAVSYRAISLLLHRPPGREAYPGDVFYLHSRLLERSCRLSDENGGGSMTALPIIETQAGDVSAYIPTNVISITDGQIFLETELFNAGERPAVNVGLSVSRVGGAAQTKAMKKASGSLRIDISQFKEMEIFTQFSSELDKATQDLLNYGHVLMELLKQPLHSPLKMQEQVVLLVTAEAKLMNEVPIGKIKDFRNELLSFFESKHSDIYTKLETEKQLPDELKQEILTAAGSFKDDYLKKSAVKE